MDPVGIVAAGAALAAAIWSKMSADAANRSATAAERSAAAEERSADAAHALLRHDEERAARERRADEQRVAPRIVPSEDYGEEFTLRADQIVGLISNVGDFHSRPRRRELGASGRYGAGMFESSPLPCHVGPNVAGAISFHVGVDQLEALSQAGGPLTVTLGYRADDSPYRGQARFVLRRHGANAAGGLQWRADQLHSERLD